MLSVFLRLRYEVPPNSLRFPNHGRRREPRFPAQPPREAISGRSPPRPYHSWCGFDWNRGAGPGTSCRGLPPRAALHLVSGSRSHCLSARYGAGGTCLGGARGVDRRGRGCVGQRLGRGSLPASSSRADPGASLGGGAPSLQRFRAGSDHGDLRSGPGVGSPLSSRSGGRKCIGSRWGCAADGCAPAHLLYPTLGVRVEARPTRGADRAPVGYPAGASDGAGVESGGRGAAAGRRR